MIIQAARASLLATLLLFSTPSFSLDVLFVHSYHSQFPWVKEYITAFKETLNSESLLEYEMDTKRLSKEHHSTQANKALTLIKNYRPKIVVTADDNALKLVGSETLKLNIPIVFLGVNANPRSYISLSSKVAGVLERPLFQRGVIQLRKLIPNTKKVMILTEQGTTTDAIIETIFNNNRSTFVNDISVHIRTARNYEHWQELILSSKDSGYDFIIIGSYSRLKNANNNHIALNTTTEWTSKHTPIPIFAFWRFAVGPGKSIGGLVLSGQHQGEAAAKIVNHYLENNKLPTPLMMTPKKGKYLFSRSELERWEIELPDDIAELTEWME